MWRVEPTISTARTVMMLRSAVEAPPPTIVWSRVLSPASTRRYHNQPILRHPPDMDVLGHFASPAGGAAVFTKRHSWCNVRLSELGRRRS